MRINHNISAMNTYSRLSMANSMQAKSLEKLSSGLRINRAGDDAAGLAISEKMRGQIRGLDQAARNAQDGISMIQTAEGGLQETHSILQRMRELAVQASNDTLDDTDRSKITQEISQLQTEVDRIGNSTKFNNKNLLDGNLGVKFDSAGSTVTVTVAGLANLSDIDAVGAGSDKTFTITETATGAFTLTATTGNIQTLNSTTDGVQTLDFSAFGVKITMDSNYVATGTAFTGLTIQTTTAAGANFQIGANNNTNERMSISITDMTQTGLSISAVSLAATSSANAAITTIDTAISTVSTERAKLGAYQNRLEHTINNLTTASENLTASESRIRDVDMAKEMMEFTKNNILNQAATAMLAQANQQPQGVLQLLR